MRRGRGANLPVMALVNAVDYLFTFLYLALLARVILSWVFPRAMHTSWGSFLFRVTNPILDPVRRVLPPVGGLDLSPLVAFLLLGVLQRVVREVLVGLLF